jgi:hypothetical protein
MNDPRFAGIGMTSARTRDRLVQRLRDQGIANPAVLDRIRNLPRHIFVDEALASRAYEDTALPIGFGQTISQPYIVARMTEALLEGGPLAPAAATRRPCWHRWWDACTRSSASKRCSSAPANASRNFRFATRASGTAMARKAGRVRRRSTAF